MVFLLTLMRFELETDCWRNAGFCRHKLEWILLRERGVPL